MSTNGNLPTNGAVANRKRRAVTPLSIKETTAMDRARQVAATLLARGVPVNFQNDIIALVFSQVSEAECFARRKEQVAITADLLIEVIDGRVIQAAAEKVTAKGY